MKSFNTTVVPTRDHIRWSPKQPDPSIDVTLLFFPIISLLLLPLCVVLVAARASLFPIGGNNVLLLVTDLPLVDLGAGAFGVGAEPVCEVGDPAGADIGSVPIRG